LVVTVTSSSVTLYSPCILITNHKLKTNKCTVFPYVGALDYTRENTVHLLIFNL
jgi:hypothetical protein